VSYWLAQDGRNLLAGGDGSHGLTSEAEAFLAGVLHHLPALLGFVAPSPNSFQRLRPQCWSGSFRCGLGIF
jgi:glutamine synthetase